MSEAGENPYASPAAISRRQIEERVKLPFSGVLASIGLLVLGFLIAYPAGYFLLMKIHSDRWLGFSELIGNWLFMGVLVNGVVACLLIVPTTVLLNQFKALTPLSVMLVFFVLVCGLAAWILATGTGVVPDFPTISGAAPPITQLVAFTEFALPFLLGFVMSAWWIHRLRARARDSL